jgi:hypothetical protein
MGAETGIPDGKRHASQGRSRRQARPNRPNPYAQGAERLPIVQWRLDAHTWRARNGRCSGGYGGPPHRPYSRAFPSASRMGDRPRIDVRTRPCARAPCGPRAASEPPMAIRPSRRPRAASRCADQPGDPPRRRVASGLALRRFVLPLGIGTNGRQFGRKSRRVQHRSRRLPRLPPTLSGVRSPHTRRAGLVSLRVPISIRRLFSPTLARPGPTHRLAAPVRIDHRGPAWLR